ncbi:hypothetical protein KIN20_005164 [Parelaphostrongylus tenuis]|uniref:Uncharacterized protein n=1 Tax=Parelaphostrongylus tenuis TaxID=148309 RepID=A0AAD5QEY4_PARTN|nr:hypothetical protein KIN20_005164 [Parelaphostrongylus tenuis]
MGSGLVRRSRTYSKHQLNMSRSHIPCNRLLLAYALEGRYNASLHSLYFIYYVLH